MRVSQQLMFDVSYRELDRTVRKLLELQRQSATGLRVNRPSDDPVAAQRAIELRAASRRIDPALRNAQYIKSWLAMTEAGLEEMKDAVNRAKEIAVEQSSDTSDAVCRSAAAIEVRHLYDRVVQAANTRMGDRYIFSGTETLTAPVTRDGNYNPDYTHGNDQAIRVRVYGDQTMTLNLTVEGAGSGVLESTQILETLRDLNDALEADDTAAIANQLDKLDQGFEAVTAFMAEVGSRVSGIEAQEETLKEMQIDLEENISNYLDADIDKVFMELTKQQLIYQAALKTTGAVTRYSLMDFIE